MKNYDERETHIIQQKDPEDWDHYKMYVVECLKQFSDSAEKNEKEINEIRLETVTNLYNLKEKVNKELKSLSDTILKLQIRVGLILSGVTILFSIAVNVALKYFLK